MSSLLIVYITPMDKIIMCTVGVHVQRIQVMVIVDMIKNLLLESLTQIAETCGSWLSRQVYPGSRIQVFEQLLGR